MIDDQTKTFLEECNEMNALILDHFKVWSFVEMGMRRLLSQILQLKPESDSLSSVIYYTPTSLGARIEIVDKVTVHYMECWKFNGEIHGTGFFPSWKKIAGALIGGMKTRNTVAHASPITVYMYGKDHCRLTSAMDDVIRVGGKAAKQELPGYGVYDLRKCNARLRVVTDALDITREFIDFLQTKHGASHEILQKLEDHLKKLDSP